MSRCCVPTSSDHRDTPNDDHAIAKTTRLAVAALLELARQPGHQPLPMLSARLRVSVSHLELLFSRLRRGGLVRSTRGPGGGYCLARAPEQIGVQDVIAAVHVDDEPPRGGGEAGDSPRRHPHRRLLGRIRADDDPFPVLDLVVQCPRSPSARCLAGRCWLTHSNHAQPRPPHAHPHARRRQQLQQGRHAFVASRATLLKQSTDVELVNVQYPVPLRAARALARRWCSRTTNLRRRGR